MNIYLHELNVNKRSLIIWSVIMVGLVALIMSMYPTILKEADNYTQIIEGMSESMQTIYDSIFGLKRLSLTDLFGFYSIYGSLFVTLVGSIYSIILSSSILSKEESDKTIEFLLAKPISRKELVLSKVLSYITNMFIFNLLISLTLFFSFQAVKMAPFSMNTFLLVCVAPLLLHMTFGMIGLFISVFITKTRTVFSISLGIVFLTYFLGMFSEITAGLNFLKYLSPFKYVDIAEIVLSGRFNTISAFVLVLINGLLVWLTFWFYDKKDITV